MIIKPIEKQYKGRLFRSRLEARWAMVFDELGIGWEYEIEGFEFDDGTRYLPDFFIRETGWFVEVKPDVELTEYEQRKINHLDANPPEYARGVCVTPKLELLRLPTFPFPYENIASCYNSKIFSEKETANGVAWNDWWVQTPQLFYWGYLNQILTPDNLQTLNRAIEKALKARFEFGEIH